MIAIIRIIIIIENRYRRSNFLAHLQQWFCYLQRTGFENSLWQIEFFARNNVSLFINGILRLTSVPNKFRIEAIRDNCKNIKIIIVVKIIMDWEVYAGQFVKQITKLEIMVTGCVWPKRKMESILAVSQNQVIRMIYRRAKIEKDGSPSLRSKGY